MALPPGQRPNLTTITEIQIFIAYITKLPYFDSKYVGRLVIWAVKFNHEKYFNIIWPGKLCHVTTQRRWQFDAHKLLLKAV